MTERPDRDPDLDWLYRREPCPDDDATRELPPVEFLALPQQPNPTLVQPAIGHQPPAGPPPMPPQGPPPRQSAPPPPPPPGPAPRTVRPRPRRRFPLFRLLGLLVLAYVVFMAATPFYHFGMANTIDAMPSGDRPAEQPGKVFLLVGSDSREDLSPEQRKKYRTGGTEGARTDTILMLVLPEKGKPALISLPRDSYVPIPGRGRNKLNAAFAWGGPKLLVQTVEQATGVRIDGYLQIGMAGFGETVDAVGGIKICLDKPMKDRDSHADFPAGCQNFDGVDALAYVRMRKSDPTGDLGRMKRQREVIGKVAGKVVSPATLWPPRWWALNRVGGQMLVRDKGTSTMDVARAAMGFVDVAKGDGHQLVVPIANPDARTSAGSSMLWNRQRAQALFGLVKGGSTEGIEQYAK